MATTSRGIVYPTTGNAVTPLATRFADLATSTDTAIGAVDTKFSNDNRQFYGPAASLGGIVDMKLNDTYQESDGNKVLWKFDGTNWVTNENGMFLIRPSSVSGTLSITSSGGVVGTNLAASVPLDIMGVFSSRFDDYLIKIRLEKAMNANEALSFIGLVGSTPITSANYYNQVVSSAAGSGPTLSYGGAQSSFVNPDGGGMKVVIDINLFSPNKAENTLASIFNVGRGGSPTMSHRTSGLETNDKLTGTRFIPSQLLSNFRMKVYGLA